MNVPERFSHAVSEGKPIGMRFSPEGAPLVYAFPDKGQALWVLEGFSEGEAISEVEKLLEGFGYVLEVFRNRAQCPHCGEIIMSRWHGDHRSCGCGGLSVDGGQTYLRREWREEKPLERSELVWARRTEKPLYNNGETVRFWHSAGGYDGEWNAKQGEVCVVDFNGAIECSEHSYDILIEEENMLYKHVEQKFVIRLVPDQKGKQQHGNDV